MKRELWIYTGVATLFFSGALLYADVAFTNGMLPVYVLVALVVTHGLAIWRISVRSFVEGWVSGLVIFGGACLIHRLTYHLFIPDAVLADISLLGHIWRIGFMLLVGSLAMTLPAYLGKRI